MYLKGFIRSCKMTFSFNSWEDNKSPVQLLYGLVEFKEYDSYETNISKILYKNFLQYIVLKNGLKPLFHE